MTESELLECLPIVQATARRFAPSGTWEDVSQSALLSLWRSNPPGGYQNLRAYASWTVRNTIRSVLRSKHTHTAQWDDTISHPAYACAPDNRILAQELLAIIQNAEYREAWESYLSDTHDTCNATSGAERLRRLRGKRVMQKAAGVL